MGFLQSSSCVITIVWLHHWDINKTPEEKVRFELHKDAAWYFEQILKTAPYDHLPPISQTFQERQTKHTKHCWRIKDGLISNVLQLSPTHGHTSIGQPANTYIHQPCVDTGCRLGDLPIVMVNRDGWQESQGNLYCQYVLICTQLLISWFYGMSTLVWLFNQAFLFNKQLNSF